MNEEFDLNKVYVKKMSKEVLIRIIENCYDKEFVVTFLPRSKDNADILIRSFKEEFENGEVPTAEDLIEEKVGCICNECGNIFEDKYTHINELNKRIWCNNCVEELCI